MTAIKITTKIFLSSDRIMFFYMKIIHHNKKKKTNSKNSFIQLS